LGLIFINQTIRMTLLSRLTFLLLFFFSTQAFGWGLLGHRIVGEIAERHLSGKAKREIKKILGNESLAMSANWADFIKSDTSYNYLGSWHYVNLKTGLSQSDVQTRLATDTIPTIYNRLTHLVSEFKSNKALTLEQKRMYLRLIVHLVGDIHQPMHAGRPEDLGGNRIQLHWFFEPSNLHRVWDEQLINYQQLSYTEYTAALDFTTKSQRKQLQATGADQWVYESYRIAEDLYKGVKKGDKLRYDYNFKHVSTLNDQLLKGGVRLAGLLNELF
jgi:hypothetical protein